MSASLLATSRSNASGWRLMGLMRRRALFCGGRMARMEAGPPCECHRDSWHCQSLWGEASTKKRDCSHWIFFFLPPPFTAVAGTWDDIFLYFGSICCQLLIIPSAGVGGRELHEYQQVGHNSSCCYQWGEGWFHEQRQKGLKVSVRASCHRLDTKDAREGRREGYIQNVSTRVLSRCARHSFRASCLVLSATWSRPPTSRIQPSRTTPYEP